jgi:hypothetical protein
MGDAAYLYELCRGDELVATGRLSTEEPLREGDEVAIGGRRGIVHSVEPMLGERAQRLVVHLLPQD